MILGIDPGLGGALALYDPQKSVLIGVCDMPTFAITVNGKTRRQIDLVKLKAWLAWYELGASHAVIEEPHAMPGQGVTSSFSFGFACGVAQMAVASLDIPMTLVRTATWKRAMNLTADKDAARKRASQLMPQSAHLWTRKCDDGRAEAALLAYYGSLVRLQR
mgnify:CR=1 FL=1